MAYKALYRTWRPERFCEVVGQDHITKVLSGQIVSSKMAHAYLFSGPRGTGKTSLAKIFAKAINCTDRQGAEPCGVCSVCQETVADNAVDIIEIDAASNNGVDSVREIRDRVNLLPAFCSFKVYIIDEVHMLSKGAFNALLKTLEEPPSHVIFILATTEPHKLPATIRSRCQQFDFKRISIDVITKRLEQVAESEGYVFNQDALKMIARAADGGMRDALSILDQCAAFGNITTQNVTSTLGGGDTQMLLALIECIAKYDEKGALEQLRAVLDAGADTKTLIKDLADVFRRMMWLCTGADLGEVEEREKKLADIFGKNACIRALDILIKKEYEMRINLRADIVLETAVMSIMCPEDDAEATSTQRLEKLEGRLRVLEEQGIPMQPTKGTAQPMQSAKTVQPMQPAAKTKTTDNDKPKKSESSKSGDIGKSLLGELKKSAYFVYTYAQKAKEVVQIGDILEIKYDSGNEIAADYLKEPTSQKAIAEILEKLVGKSLSINIVVEKPLKASSIDTDILKMFSGTEIEEI